MDPLTPTSPGDSLAESETLQRDLRALRLTLQITLVSLLILAGSVGIYIFRQVSLLRRQVDQSNRTAQQVVQHYNKALGPQGQAFEKKLQEYALNHPEFRARLARFYAPPAVQTNQPPAAELPAPPAAPPNPP